MIPCLRGAVDIILALLSSALQLSRFGNTTYMPWQEDRLEQRCEVDIGPENGLPEEVRGLRMECDNRFWPENGLRR
jgi:hypothetical protein